MRSAGRHKENEMIVANFEGFKRERWTAICGLTGRLSKLQNLIKKIEYLGFTLMVLWDGCMGEDANSDIPWLTPAERAKTLEHLLAYYFACDFDVEDFKLWFAERNGGWFSPDGHLQKCVFGIDFAGEVLEYAKQKKIIPEGYPVAMRWRENG
jgi:hypothetical protein